MCKRYDLDDPKVIEKTSSIIDSLITKEASNGVDKYFNNLKDFQKKLSDSMEAVRCIKDLSHGLANPKFKLMLDGLQEQLHKILVETELERDKLNSQRFSPLEIAPEEKTKEEHQIAPLNI